VQIVRHGRSIPFQAAWVMVPRSLFQQVPNIIAGSHPLTPA